MNQFQIKLFALFFALLPCTTYAHKGPDPVARWVFDSQAVDGDKLTARLGPDGKLSGRLRVVEDEYGQSLHFSGWAADCVLAEELRDVAKVLPKTAITVSAWVSVEKPQSKSGIIGTLEDNGDEKAGCLTAKLPSSDDWQDFYAGTSFEVAANEKFQLRVAEQTAYLARTNKKAFRETNIFSRKIKRRVRRDAERVTSSAKLSVSANSAFSTIWRE